MKKLMIAAAAAAMIGGAEAKLAQVYDFTATLKTTQCKEAKVSAALARYYNTGSYDGLELFDQGDKVGLRKQDSRKIMGVIWGCLCPTIQDLTAARMFFPWTVYNGRTLGGYMFWDQDMNDYFRPAKTHFYWNVLNRMDAMNKCEGAFTLWNNRFGQAIHLEGAGFGTVKENNCDTYMPTMSGSCVGYRQPNFGDFTACKFCLRGNGCLVDPFCDVCFGIGAYNPFRTIAYGTWKIKFNSSMSKKLSNDGRLSRVYKFKKAGRAADELAWWETHLPPFPVRDAEDGEIEDMIDEDEDIEYVAFEDFISEDVDDDGNTVYVDNDGKLVPDFIADGLKDNDTLIEEMYGEDGSDEADAFDEDDWS